MGLSTNGIFVEPDIMFIPHTIDQAIWQKFIDGHICWSNAQHIDKTRAIQMSDIMKMMESCKIWSYLTVEYFAEWKQFMEEIVRNQISPPRSADLKMHFVVPEEGITFFLHYTENDELLLWKNTIDFDAAFFDVIYGEHDPTDEEALVDPNYIITWDKLPAIYDATKRDEFLRKYRINKERYIKTYKYSDLFKQILITRDATPLEGLAYLLQGRHNKYFRA